MLPPTQMEFRRPDRPPARDPLITIGIPSYRRPDLLRQALASIAAQRACADFEVVVCDDGHRAETRAVVESCGIANIRFHVNEPPLGAVGNWNRCIELAAGRWVTILHEDDMLYPWFLRLVVAHLNNDVAAVAVRCVEGKNPPQLVEPGRNPGQRTYRPAWFLKSSMTPFPGVLFSRAVARRLGGFDPQEGGVADYAFWYKLACAGRIEVLQANAAFYRVHEQQWTVREWPRMLRRGHLLRLRVAREQFGSDSRFAKWAARFYSARMARAYTQRFTDGATALQRMRGFARIPLHGISSGWVWAALRLMARQPRAAANRSHTVLVYAPPGDSALTASSKS